MYAVDDEGIERDVRSEVIMRNNTMYYREALGPKDEFDWQFIQQHIVDGRNLLIRLKAYDKIDEVSVARIVKACTKQDQFCRYYLIDVD